MVTSHSAQATGLGSYVPSSRRTAAAAAAAAPAPLHPGPSLLLRAPALAAPPLPDRVRRMAQAAQAVALAGCPESGLQELIGELLAAGSTRPETVDRLAQALREGLGGSSLAPSSRQSLFSLCRLVLYSAAPLAAARLAQALASAWGRGSAEERSGLLSEMRAGLRGRGPTGRYLRPTHRIQVMAGLVRGLGARELGPGGAEEPLRELVLLGLRVAEGLPGGDVLGLMLRGLIEGLGSQAMAPARLRTCVDLLLQADAPLAADQLGQAFHVLGSALGGQAIPPELLQAVVQALVERAAGLPIIPLRHAFTALASVTQAPATERERHRLADRAFARTAQRADARAAARRRDCLAPLLAALPPGGRESLASEVAYGICLVMWGGLRGPLGSAAVADSLLAQCDHMPEEQRVGLAEGALYCLDEVDGGNGLRLVLDRFLDVACPASLSSLAWVLAQALRREPQHEVLHMLLEPGCRAAPLQVAALFCALAAGSATGAFRSREQQQALARTALPEGRGTAQALRQGELLRMARLGQQLGLDPLHLARDTQGLSREEVLSLVRIACSTASRLSDAMLQRRLVDLAGLGIAPALRAALMDAIFEARPRLLTPGLFMLMRGQFLEQLRHADLPQLTPKQVQSRVARRLSQAAGASLAPLASPPPGQAEAGTAEPPPPQALRAEQGPRALRRRAEPGTLMLRLYDHWLASPALQAPVAPLHPTLAGDGGWARARASALLGGLQLIKEEMERLEVEEGISEEFKTMAMARLAQRHRELCMQLPGTAGAGAAGSPPPGPAAAAASALAPPLRAATLLGWEAVAPLTPRTPATPPSGERKEGKYGARAKHD